MKKRLTREEKKKRIKKYARETVVEVLTWLQKKYNLEERFIDPQVIVSFHKKRDCSYGGWGRNRKGQNRPYINLNLSNTLNYKPQVQEEYDWYNDDPVIGKKWCATWRESVKFEIVHECAHVLELLPLYSHDNSVKRRLKKRFGPAHYKDDHTETFQKIYRVLRRKFINKKKKSK